MDAIVTIHKADGTNRITARVGEGSKRYFLLMEHDYIVLKFSTDTPTILHLGDFVEITNVGRYELVDITRAEYNKTSGGYDYEIRLDAQYWKFKNKLMKFLPQVGSNETSWTYTDTIANHLQQVLDNIKAQAYDYTTGSAVLIAGRETFLYNGTTDWAYSIDSSVDTAKAVTIQYDSTNIIDALADIAEAYECEWWVEQNVIHFGKCQFGATPLNLEMGKEIVDVSRTDSKETYATRIYAYGSDRNIPSTYRKTLIFDATLTDGKLHDTAREIELRYFQRDLLGSTTGQADTQVTLDFTPVTDTALAITYPSRTGALTLPTSSDTGDFALAGTMVTESSGSVQWTFLSVENPYLALSNLRVSFTPTAVTTQDGSTTMPQTLETFFEIQIDYYEVDDEGTHTKKTTYVEARAAAVWKGLNTAINFNFADEFITIPTANIVRVCITRNSQINFVAKYSQTYAALETARPQIDGKVNITGQLAIFDGKPEVCANGVVVEVLDNDGEVTETINGCIFNAAYEKSNRKITLPNGKTIAAGTKYRLPQLKTAIVPAAYFTSIYTVFSKYTDVVTNGVVNSRLLLPEKDESNNALKGYVDAATFEAQEEAVEDVVVFDDIYPSRTSSVVSVKKSEEYTAEQEEFDGSTTETKYREFIIQDDLFTAANPFDRDYILDGETLQITFQSGLLNGMTFDVELLADNFSFQIKRDSTTLIPNEVIAPKAGDEFILHGFNIAMLSDSRTDYIAAAEQRLLAKAREYVAQLNTDTSTYDVTLACDIAYQTEADTPDGLYLGVGRSVNLIHPGFFANGRISRVIGYEIPLDFAYDNPIYKIGEKATYSRIGAIEDKLDNLGNAYGNFAASGSSGSTSQGQSVYLIAQADPTPPTDKNAYSALRSRAEFVVKTTEQTIKHLWTFLKGVRFGNFIAGATGAQIDAAGNAEVESIFVRSWLKVQELIYNRLNALEGDTSFADVGTIDNLTTNADGTYTAIMRRRWEGDFTSFQPGDVVYGYVNKLDNTTAKEYYKAWAWVKSVDRTNNQLVLVSYADTETPAGKNYPVAASMIITRWGNNIEPTVDTFVNPDYAAVIGKRDGVYINKRQRSFFISCDDGNLIELMGVNKPKLTANNYGTILGIIPDGLLDSKTEELINKDQPYLFARGIIVQDLIRVGYEGVTTRTANYRGLWSRTNAESDTEYYRDTPGMYDTVTWRGALWQCASNRTTDEPSDASAAWVKMTASTDDAQQIKIWQLTPSANIVSVRQTEVRPETLSCSVTLLSSNNASQTFESNTALLDAGAKLYYSADGINWAEFIIGATEPLELEDGSGVIETEDSTDGSSYLSVGGNDIDTATIGDRIIFQLRDKDTEEILAQTHVPVVKDGKRAAFQSTAFLRSNFTPDTPTGGTYESPVPTSVPYFPNGTLQRWYDAIPAGEEILWATTRIFSDEEETTWSTPRQMTDTATYDVEFSDVDQNPGTPTTDPDNWFDPVDDKDTKDFTTMLWRAERQKKNGTWDNWTIVRIKGEQGSAGDYVSYAFKQSETKPDKPTATNAVIPPGWEDAPTSTGKWWMSKCLISGVNDLPKGEWSDPVQVTGEDGQDGSYIDFKYAKAAEGTTPTWSATLAAMRTPTGWEDTPPQLSTGEALYMIQAEIDYNNALVGTWSDPVRISGEKGEQGDKGDKGDKGDDGIAGRDGLMVYPAGYYSPDTTYRATSETAPVVMYNDNYYVLRRGSTYHGADESDTRNTPALEVANAPTVDGESTSRWQLFDKFNAIFADIVMAEFAKLASAVFYGDWLISQKGTLTTNRYCVYQVLPQNTLPTAIADADLRAETPTGWGGYPLSSEVGSTDKIWCMENFKYLDGTLVNDWNASNATIVTSAGSPKTIVTTLDSDQYQAFKHGSFEPNFAVNFLTGEMTAGSGLALNSNTRLAGTLQLASVCSSDWIGQGVANFPDANLFYLPAITKAQEDSTKYINLGTGAKSVGKVIRIFNSSSATDGGSYFLNCIEYNTGDDTAATSSLRADIRPQETIELTCFKYSDGTNDIARWIVTSRYQQQSIDEGEIPTTT